MKIAERRAYSRLQAFHTTSKLNCTGTRDSPSGVRNPFGAAGSWLCFPGQKLCSRRNISKRSCTVRRNTPGLVLRVNCICVMSGLTRISVPSCDALVASLLNSTHPTNAGCDPQVTWLIMTTGLEWHVRFRHDHDGEPHGLTRHSIAYDNEVIKGQCTSHNFWSLNTQWAAIRVSCLIDVRRGGKFPTNRQLRWWRLTRRQFDSRARRTKTGWMARAEVPNILKIWGFGRGQNPVLTKSSRCLVQRAWRGALSPRYPAPVRCIAQDST